MGYRFRKNPKCVLKTSYLLTRIVAQSKTAFAIAEDLVLSATVNMCWEMIGQAADHPILQSHWVSLSWTRPQTPSRIKSSPASPLMWRMLHCCWFFVGYRWDSGLYKHILFLWDLRLRNVSAAWMITSLRTTWTGRVVLGWAVMVRRQWLTGIRHRADRAPEPNWTHCFFHPGSPAEKNMSPEFHEMVAVSGKSINFIKSNAVKSRCCQVLWGQCGEMALRRTGPPAFVWTEEWGLLFTPFVDYYAQLNFTVFTYVTLFHCWNSHFKGERVA